MPTLACAKKFHYGKLFPWSVTSSPIYTVIGLVHMEVSIVMGVPQEKMVISWKVPSING
jgi:hypothetical protein